MNNQDVFTAIIQDISKKSNELKETNETGREELLQKLFTSLADVTSLSHTYGVPPPQDSISICNDSFLSESIHSDCSLEIDKTNEAENLSRIKHKNKEMQSAVKDTIKYFKMISKEFLSNSFTNTSKTSLILQELGNIKKNLSDVAQESRIFKGSELSMISQDCDAMLLDIIEEVSRIQSEIIVTTDKLRETEKMIELADEENRVLVTELEILEKNVKDLLVTEENELNRAVCKCIVI